MSEKPKNADPSQKAVAAPRSEAEELAHLHEQARVVRDDVTVAHEAVETRRLHVNDAALAADEDVVLYDIADRRLSHQEARTAVIGREEDGVVQDTVSLGGLCLFVARVPEEDNPRGVVIVEEVVAEHRILHVHDGKATAALGAVFPDLIPLAEEP